MPATTAAVDACARPAKIDRGHGGYLAIVYVGYLGICAALGILVALITHREIAGWAAAFISGAILAAALHLWLRHGPSDGEDLLSGIFFVCFALGALWGPCAGIGVLASWLTHSTAAGWLIFTAVVTAAGAALQLWLQKKREEAERAELVSTLVRAVRTHR
jgi:hypothetical protein